MYRNIKLLALFNFFTDFELYGAIIVIYFAYVTGSVTLAMSILAVTMVSSSVFEVPTGIYSDRIGRKKTVILGALSRIVAVVFYAVGMNYWFLFVGALFEGLSRAWYSGNNDALLHDSLHVLGKRQDFDHYLGKTASMFQLALMISAVVGSVLASWSFSLVMWLSVIPQTMCLIIAFLLQEPPASFTKAGNVYAHVKEALMLFRVNKKVRILTIYDMLHAGIGESTYQLRSVFINSLWPLWAVGIAKMLSNLGGFVSYWYSGRIIRKLGAPNILLYKDVYNRALNIVATGYPTVLSPVLLASNSLSYGPSEVGTKKLFHAEFTDAQRATLSSLTSLLGNVFFGIVSVGIGLLADVFTPAKSILIAQIIMIPSLLLTKKLVSLYREK